MLFCSLDTTNNVWYNQAHWLIGMPYLSIITSNVFIQNKVTWEHHDLALSGNPGFSRRERGANLKGKGMATYYLANFSNTAYKRRKLGRGYSCAIFCQVADPGFPRCYAPTPGVFPNLLFCLLYAENCMKMKWKIWSPFPIYTEN